VSEVKLNLIDAQHVLHGTIHGSFADACVAALSAEPETIAELAWALTRYRRPLHDHGPFATFHSSVNSASPQLDAEPWDAGIVVIDLTARIVASESTYSMPEPSGEVHYHDGIASTDITVLYRLPDDWLFVNSIDAYQWSRERRMMKRAAQPAGDARAVLYGSPLLEFIADAVTDWTSSTPRSESPWSESTPWSAPTCRRFAHDEPHNLRLNGQLDDDEADDAVAKAISATHARWLMTPHEELHGHSPRDVMLASQDFIDFDLHTRALQWSLQDEGPPCLPQDSFAYRFAGFGTHEWVIYYDLVRHLLWSALETVRQTLVCRDRRVTDNVHSVEHAEDFTSIQSSLRRIDSQIAILEEIKTTWLEQPQPDYGGRIPAILLDNERKRLPIALRPRDMIIDEDCPVCRMFGDETTLLGMGVGFWHLDGCNMDDDFAFSSYRTRAEWEAENNRREEFNKEFNRKWEERQQRIARGEQPEPDPYFDPDPFPFDDIESTLLDRPSRHDDDEELPQ
jgi:hypothetical protein